MESLIDKTFVQGGMALAFVIMLWSYRDLWQRRQDELKTQLNIAREERSALMDVLSKNTTALEHLSTLMQANPPAPRGRDK